MRICESFRSLQDEGKSIGRLTYIVRMSGCNLDCSWCDKRYTASEEGTEMTVDGIMDTVRDDENVCITGGEPLLQKDCIELLKRLSDAGKNVVLDTNGSIDIGCVPKSDRISISMDIKCPSSGMSDRMIFDNIALLEEKDQLKFVISDGDDLDYAVDILQRYNPKCEVFFTPVGGMDVEPLAEVVIEKRLNVRVLPQLRKFIWGNKRDQ